MTDSIEFTLEDIKSLNFFEPQAALDCLNDMLAEKIAVVSERMKRTYCKHASVGYEMIREEYVCNHCGRIWK